MSCDRLTKYLENNEEELMEKFIETKRDQFEAFVFDEWQDAEADYGDMLYDMEKDRLMIEGKDE